MTLHVVSLCFNFVPGNGTVVIVMFVLIEFFTLYTLLYIFEIGKQQCFSFSE